MIYAFLPQNTQHMLQYFFFCFKFIFIDHNNFFFSSKPGQLPFAKCLVSFFILSVVSSRDISPSR